MFGNRSWYEVSAHSLTDLCSVWMVFGSWLAVHACFMFRGDHFVYCSYVKQEVWEKRKILNQQWVHPCFTVTTAFLIIAFMSNIYGTTGRRVSCGVDDGKPVSPPLGPFFSFWCSVCAYLNWVSKGFLVLWLSDFTNNWLYKQTLSYHRWVLIADSTKVMPAWLALSCTDNVGTPFERV
jgi:hypothetical protein